MVGLISKGFNIIKTLFCDAIVSPKTGFEVVIDSILNIFKDILLGVYEIFVKLIMLITRFMLMFVDFIFVFIRQFVGINTDFSNINSIEEDIVFKFLRSDAVKSTMRYIIILAIILLIVLCIFAILKTEYQAATTGSSNSKKQVLAGALKSIFMIILVPILMFGGIFLSNALLKTLDNVTTGGNSVSFGNHVFIASTYQANCYRRYALDNYQIPITYNFEEVDQSEFMSHAETGTIKELEDAFKSFSQKSGWDRGFTTYQMFFNEEYLSLDEIEYADDVARNQGDSNGSAYHLVYDRGLFTRKDEYLVMADVIDYSLKNNERIYFKTPQDIWASYGGNPDSEIRNLFAIGSDTKGEYYSFNIQYASKDSYVTYKSYNTRTPGVQDEANGSVFVVCIKQDNKLVPLVDGKNFSSSYSSGQNLVIARGLFDEGGYPTAIREEGQTITCYRDKLNVPYIMDLLPRVSYEKPQGGTTELPGLQLIGGGFEMITGLDIHDFIPYVYFNFDILRLFNKSYVVVNSLDDGGFTLNYMFNDDGSSLYNFYNYKDINILVMFFCSTILLSILFKALFGVISRVFDIVLLYVTYPAVCATIVVDNGTRFSTWVKTTINTVINVYGVVLGINLVLIIQPIIDSIQIFSEADFQRMLMSGLIPPDWTAGFVNLIIYLIMLLASFTLFKTLINLVSSLIAPGFEKEGGNLLERGKQTTETFGKMVKTTGDIVSGKIIVDAVTGIKDAAIGFIPGSAIIGSIADSIKFNSEQDAIASSRNDLKAAMQSGDKAKTASMTAWTESTNEKYKIQK